MPSYSSRGILIGSILLLGALLYGCAKPADPVDQINTMLPRLNDALNRHDAAAIEKLATSNFAADQFLKEMFTQGGGGQVTLSVQRIRIVPGEIRLTAGATYSPSNVYSVSKEVGILFAGEKKLKMDRYTIVHLPPAGSE